MWWSSLANPHNGHNSMLLCAKCRNLKIDWLSREARAEKRGGAMKVLEKRKPHISPRLRQLIETYCGMSAEQFVDLIVRRQRPTFNIHEFIDPRKRTMPVCRRRTNSTSRPSRSSRPCSSRLATKPIRWEWRSSRAPIRCTTARDYVLLDDGGILATARIDDDAGAGYFVALDSRGHIYAALDLHRHASRARDVEYVVRKDRIGCPEADNGQRVVVSTARHGIADNADLAAVLPVARSEAVADERNRA